jgi:GrpB-like predicted nucleotidyltransferase (UPF0157 family)
MSGGLLPKLVYAGTVPVVTKAGQGCAAMPIARPEREIRVVDHDPSWPQTFVELRAAIWPVVADVALSVEHVGSTAVPGLAAKPVIDMDVVVLSRAEIPTLIGRVATLGYRHRGNLGIEDREAFEAPAGFPAHHLYACVQGSPALANHLTIRDHLRRNPEARAAYGELKKRLAGQFPTDIDSYVAGKTDFLLELLRNAGFREPVLRAIRNANQPT